MFYKKVSLAVSLLICIAFAIKGEAQSDTIYNRKDFTYSEMKANWSNFSNDAAWKVVVAEMKRQGFSLLDNENTMWGMAGYAINPLTRTKEAVVFCAFDFYKKGYDGLASMVWIKKGGKTYKCCITFPQNEKNADSAFAKSIEYYVDGNNTLQKAKSFGRCWRRACKANCPSFCLSAITTCGGVAIALATAGLGITTPVAIGIFAGCAGVTCGGCLAVQALSCL